MIKTYDDWCKTKTTVLIAHEESEKVADSFRITQKKRFCDYETREDCSLGSKINSFSTNVCDSNYIRSRYDQIRQMLHTRRVGSSAIIKDKKERPISEAEEFQGKIQPKDYFIEKHFEKTVAQIVEWSMLMSSEMYRQALLKDLDDMYVPVGTNNDNVVALINQVIRGDRISFSD